MNRNKLEEQLFSEISSSHNFQVSEVRRAVYSFFGSLVRDSRRLPFDNPTRIYSREKFEEYVSVMNIPSIGRIGPVYSRYLKWRENESKNFKQEHRGKYRKGLTQDEIEHMAEDILSGKTPQPVQRKKSYELYNRIWMVGKVGKRLAKQVIPKEKKDGI